MPWFMAGGSVSVGCCTHGKSGHSAVPPAHGTPLGTSPRARGKHIEGSSPPRDMQCLYKPERGKARLILNLNKQGEKAMPALTLPCSSLNPRMHPSTVWCWVPGSWGQSQILLRHGASLISRSSRLNQCWQWDVLPKSLQLQCWVSNPGYHTEAPVPCRVIRLGTAVPMPSTQALCTASSWETTRSGKKNKKLFVGQEENGKKRKIQPTKHILNFHAKRKMKTKTFCSK